MQTVPGETKYKSTVSWRYVPIPADKDNTYNVLCECINEHTIENVQEDEYLYWIGGDAKIGIEQEHTNVSSVWTDDLWRIKLPTI